MLAEARREVFGFVEGLCDTRRLHSELGYRSPANFEKFHHAARSRSDLEGGLSA